MNGSPGNRFTYVDYFLPGDVAGDWDVVTTDEADESSKAKYDSRGNLVIGQLPDPGENAIGINAANDAPTTVVSYSYIPGGKALGITTRITQGTESTPSTTPRVLAEYDETRINRKVVNTRGEQLLAADRIDNRTSTDAVLDTVSYLDAGFVSRANNSYGLNGQLAVTKDAQGNQTSIVYDVWSSGTGQVESIQNPNGEISKSVYDSAGNLLSRETIDDNSQNDNKVQRAYDGLSRLVAETITIVLHHRQ